MGDEHKLISIIVPVYNVETYIETCVESLLNQTYKNIEVILIDDGSNDDSGDICDKCAEKSSKVRVHHKDNGGLSSARNVGLRIAKGSYVTFVDSDDYIEPFYVEKLYLLVEEYDVKMAICPYTVVVNGRENNIGIGYKRELLDTETCLKRMLLEQGFTVSACAKLYSIDLFQNIKYPEGKLYEDNGTTYKLIMKCDFIAYDSCSIYNYILRQGSITSNDFNSRKLDYIRLTDEACEIMQSRYETLGAVCDVRKSRCRINILRQLINIDKNKKTQRIQKQICADLCKLWVRLKKNPYADSKLKIAVWTALHCNMAFKLMSKIYERSK